MPLRCWMHTHQTLHVMVRQEDAQPHAQHGQQGRATIHDHHSWSRHHILLHRRLPMQVSQHPSIILEHHLTTTVLSQTTGS